MIEDTHTERIINEMGTEKKPQDRYDVCKYKFLPKKKTFGTQQFAIIIAHMWIEWFSVN